MTSNCLGRRRVGLAALGLALAMAVPSAAHAWWRGGGIGFGFGFMPFAPFYGPPAYYYPPPVYYPPSTYYTPPSAGQACYAGAYVCPLDVPAPQGAPCSCPTNTGRAGGRVG